MLIFGITFTCKKNHRNMLGMRVMFDLINDLIARHFWHDNIE
ncbi:Uncharacterised protein [Vibrio cholerae]|nr:Uncharacterised protein [Vibrio cholerae]